MSKVQVMENGCWLWTGQKTVQGYGWFWLGRKPGLRKSNLRATAHRWIWEHRNGPVPEGRQLDHFVCDTRSCVNPDHVRPVTPRENTLRGESPCAWNLSKTHCRQGHEFTEENIYWVPNRPGGRDCRICRRERNRKAARKRKELA